MRYKYSAWAFGGPTGDKRLAEEVQLGRCAAEQSKHNRLHMYSGKATLAVMYFLQVRVVGRSSTAAGNPAGNIQIIEISVKPTGGILSKQDQRRGCHLWATSSFTSGNE
jgi:hypothetical protein